MRKLQIRFSRQNKAFVQEKQATIERNYNKSILHLATGHVEDIANRWYGKIRLNFSKQAWS